MHMCFPSIPCALSFWLNIGYGLRNVPKTLHYRVVWTNCKMYSFNLTSETGKPMTWKSIRTKDLITDLNKLKTIDLHKLVNHQIKNRSRLFWHWLRIEVGISKQNTIELTISPKLVSATNLRVNIYYVNNIMYLYHIILFHIYLLKNTIKNLSYDKHGL